MTPSSLPFDPTRIRLIELINPILTTLGLLLLLPRLIFFSLLAHHLSNLESLLASLERCSVNFQVYTPSNLQTASPMHPFDLCDCDLIWALAGVSDMIIVCVVSWVLNVAVLWLCRQWRRISVSPYLASGGPP